MILPILPLRIPVLLATAFVVVFGVRASALPAAHAGQERGVGARVAQVHRTVDPATPAPPAAIPLASGWSYLADPQNVGLSQNWGGGGAAGQSWTAVTLPNDFNATVTSTSDRGTVGWYQVQFTGPPISAGRSWRVAFESVRRNAQVWLNGYQIGSNSDPYAPFSLPASTLIPGGTNLLVVRVDNVRSSSALPEDWWNWGGIMGPVTLEPAGRVALKQLGVMPQLGCGFHCGTLLVQGTLQNSTTASLSPRIVVRATSPSGVTTTLRQSLGKLPSGASRAISVPVALRPPVALWSPSSPALYDVQIQVVVGNRIEQVNTLHTGLRSVEVRGGILYLNGHRLWLHGAAIHEDISGSGAAMSDGDVDTIVNELRSIGANITRAHYLLSPRLLNALDQAGILVWAQPPVDHADPQLRTAGGRARALAALRSTLLGDRSHPSVIIDSVGNELSPTPDKTPGTLKYLEQAIPLARQLNPGVPVALDTYCYPGFPAQKIYSQLNVLGISSYFGWYPGLKGHSIANFSGLQPFLAKSHSRYPKLALAVSEYGAESLYDGPSTTKGTYEFQSWYVQRTLGLLSRLPYMNGSIYWTLREFAVSPGWTGGAPLPAGSAPDGIHHKGLIAYDGTDKPAFTVAQQLFAQTPSFVH